MRRPGEGTVVCYPSPPVQIGEMLIEQGHLTREGLEEALDWQVLYGGRLGTNLLELQLCEEDHLARALGKQHGCEVAWGNLAIDPALIGLIPPHIAQRDEMVPWKIDRRRVKMLVTRIDPGKLDQLSYKIGKPCAAVVAPEFRVVNLLRAHYGAMRQMRALDFGVVPDEGRLSQRKRKQQQNAAPQGPAELIDEKAFNDIYAQVLRGRSAPDVPVGAAGAEAAPAQAAPAQAAPAKPAPAQPAPAQPAPAKPPKSPTPPATRPAPPPAQQIPPPPVVNRPPPALEPWPEAPAEPAPPPPVVAAPPPEVAEQEETTEKVPGKQEPVIEALPEDAILGEVTPPPAVVPAAAGWEAALPARTVDVSPLAFEKALEMLETVQDRDSIARIVLRASRSKAERALLLLVQGNVVLGWDGLGEGLENGAAARIAVALGAPSAFDLVVKTRSHFLGPLQKTPLNVRFLAQAGKKVPLSSLVLPILHRGRVSHVLYVDNGHKKQAPTDVGEMLILSQRIAQSVEALVDKRKAGRK